MTSKDPNYETGIILFTFDDDGEPIEFDVNKCPENIRANLTVHGASQKLGDSYAGAKKATEGTDITPTAYARSQVASVMKQLYEGEWTVRAAGGQQVTDLAIALSECTGATLEECTEKLSKSEKEEKAALRKHPGIKAVLDRLKAERAAKKAQESAANADSGPDLAAFVTA